MIRTFNSDHTIKGFIARDKQMVRNTFRRRAQLSNQGGWDSSRFRCRVSHQSLGTMPVIKDVSVGKIDKNPDPSRGVFTRYLCKKIYKIETLSAAHLGQDTQEPLIKGSRQVGRKFVQAKSRTSPSCRWLGQGTCRCLEL